ncbi:hypothetical protein NPIL_651591 [Nephila pilipes]|uniref:Large ribosomal subunit protein eL29 n=1 Tax=Nephila pilipes TaxID=299642 RepID=A0A8X6IP79_NEPPI|nr:hypothetical protein NPIL_651591 [Nephila pilipes]
MNFEDQMKTSDATAKDQTPPLENVSSLRFKTPMNDTPKPSEKTEKPTEEFLADHSKEVLNLIQLQDAFAKWARLISSTPKDSTTFQNVVTELERNHIALLVQQTALNISLFQLPLKENSLNRIIARVAEKCKKKKNLLKIKLINHLKAKGKTEKDQSVKMDSKPHQKAGRKFLRKLQMAKSKNHTNHNQNRKDHRNGIMRPKRFRKESMKGVCPKFLKNLKYARKHNKKPVLEAKKTETK